MTNALHSMKNGSWGTPDDVIERVKRTFGGHIDLDPCSSDEHNQRIGALLYYASVGQHMLWEGCVFVNPPGGRGVAKEFWLKAMEASKACASIIWLAYSLEQLQTLQCEHVPSPVSFTMCVPKKRIKFVGAGTSPTHGNAIIYIPGQLDLTWRFHDAFQDLGAVAVRAR